ncbi:MAG: hypothetical protein R6U37_09420 [Dehalococcoidia bacterium]
MKLRFWKKPRDQIAHVVSVYETNVGLKIESPQERHKWQACGAGARKLIGDLQWLEAFDVADTLNKARLCFELGLQPMLTVWQFERASEESEEEIRNDYLKAQELIDELRFTLSKDTVDLYMNFHQELRGYLSSLVYPKENYTGMFHLRYRECISTDRIINLKALGVEADTWQMFLEDCRGYSSMMLKSQDVEDFFGIFNEATAYMLARFDELSKVGIA